MPNDRKNSELLSKSFHGVLTNDEQDELEASIAGDTETAKYAALSRLIQDSVTDLTMATESGSDDVTPALPDDAKKRLRDSVRKAKLELSNATLDKDVQPVTARTAGATTAGDTRFTKTRFTMLREIGKGGLGTVWLARDEDLKRTVAVKEMLPGKSESPKHLQRFQREATITGFLEHPNVVPLYMFGINSETGKPFYAMRFLGKQTLADAIHEYHLRRLAGQTASIDLHRLLTVFLDVCQAIAYANSRGVVHRDLKPDNVALDSFGQVIVLDWGIAKVLSDGELAIQSSLSQYTSDDSMLTKTMAGEIVGTPLYMAPEQASGDLDSIDERTDVYGLGAVLFSILTGQAPHQETSEKLASESIQELLKHITHQESPRPSDRNPSIPRDLEAICVRAMSNQRFARHASAQSLAEDVEHWMAGQQEKRKKYEAVRLEGNNLRGQFNSWIRDLGTNVRFMSTLPPIQGLIDAITDEDAESENVWRERLSTIFRGLLKSNSDFVAVTYCRVADGARQEIVRVEKPTPESETRAIPRSRLVASELTAFGNSVMARKPDDVHIALSPCPMHDVAGATAPLRLEAGVPVFDRAEEPFGMVVIEGNFNRLIASQSAQRNRVASQLLIVDENQEVLLEDAERLSGLVGQDAGDVLSTWTDIKRDLDLNNDHVDENGEVFATRVFLVCRKSPLDLILSSEANAGYLER